jgi:hypothetical protein
MEPTGYRACIAANTRAVVATCVVLVPTEAVGAVGVPDIAGEAIVGEIRWVFCWVKFEPSLHTDMVLPVGMATVVPPVGVVPFLAVALVIVAVYADAL